VSRRGQAVKALQECPSLVSAIAEAVSHEGNLRIDVLSLLLAEDLYGEKYPISKEDFALWSSANAMPILFEGDLGSAEFTGYIGTWNLEFLRWLKAVSVATGEEVSIYYDHERGDTPYEGAWWCSSPASVEGEVEIFGIESNDGMDEPQWRREVVRHADGQLEVRGE
jgi:hypothetical protein